MNIRSLLLLSCILGFSTCTKVESNVADYYPQVKTLSVAIQSDGSVIVTGQVTKTGDKPIIYAGFCMDTVPIPDMITNQVMVDTLTNNTFTGRYTSFNALKKYYFRAWVANENGYAIGNVLSADSIVPQASSIPCSLPMDKLYLTTPYYADSEAYTSVSAIPANTTLPTLYAYTNSHYVYMTFYDYPTTTKTYKTSSNSSPTDNSAVSILVDGYQVDGGASVYVKQISPTTFEITICGVNVNMTSGSYTLSTHFNSPL